MRYAILATVLLCSTALYSTHLRCGQITVKQLDPFSLRVEIKVEVWTNLLSPVLFGGEQDILDFGDGSTMTIPERPNEVINAAGAPYVGYASFTVDHTYAGFGRFIVSYSEPNRNADIVNASASVNTPFYLETGFVLIEGSLYQSPVPLQPPMFLSFAGSDLTASVAAKDPNDFTLLYETATPRQARGKDVDGYELPENFSLSQSNGLITWDNKFKGSVVLGEYLFGVKISQYTRLNGQWVQMGFVFRDYQIVLLQEEGVGEGRISGNKESEVAAENNEVVVLKTFAFHKEAEAIELLPQTELSTDSYSFKTYDSTSESTFIKVGMFTFKNSPLLQRENPYLLSVRAVFTSGTSVYVKDFNYSIYTTELRPVVAVITGTEDEVLPSIFSPNPVENFLAVNSINVPAELSVFDVNGRIIFHSQISFDSIDVSFLPPGLYFFVVTGHSGIIAKERIVKR